MESNDGDNRGVVGVKTSMKVCGCRDYICMTPRKSSKASRALSRGELLGKLQQGQCTVGFFFNDLFSV
jgi:hypothetical protein